MAQEKPTVLRPDDPADVGKRPQFNGTNIVWSGISATDMFYGEIPYGSSALTVGSGGAGVGRSGAGHLPFTDIEIVGTAIEHFPSADNSWSVFRLAPGTYTVFISARIPGLNWDAYAFFGEDPWTPPDYSWVESVAAPTSANTPFVSFHVPVVTPPAGGTSYMEGGVELYCYDGSPQTITFLTFRILKIA